MKKLVIIFIVMFAFLQSKAQKMTFSFDAYLTFVCDDKNYSGYDVINSPSIFYDNIGFGINNVTIDLDSKTVTNNYYVRDDYSGTITYTNLDNYSEKNGIVTFQAKRINPETKKMYTEYFVINQNALKGEENVPYLITYWYDNGVKHGNVINKELIY